MQEPGLNFNLSKWKPTANSEWVKSQHLHTHPHAQRPLESE